MIRNKGNLRWAARCCKVTNPFLLSPEEVSLHLRECTKWLNHFKIHGTKYRRQHLLSRLEAARNADNKVVEKRILRIMAEEKSRSFWRRLNYALGK